MNHLGLHLPSGRKDVRVHGIRQTWRASARVRECASERVGLCERTAVGVIDELNMLYTLSSTFKSSASPT